MLEQLLKELLSAGKSHNAFSAEDWSKVKAAEFDEQAAFDEHIRDKGHELMALCREHGIPCLFAAVVADNSERTVTASLMGSGIVDGSDANPMSRTTFQMLMAYATLQSNGMAEVIDRVAEVAAYYDTKKARGNI